jgi:pyruvate/2-oxoglutarate dehydrogenase complex dihydrolipoamide acyltransferase (E2) component
MAARWCTGLYSVVVVSAPLCSRARWGRGRDAHMPCWVWSRDLTQNDGQSSLGHAMTLSLTFDHRAVDGAPTAEFLQSVKRLIESHVAYSEAE